MKKKLGSKTELVAGSLTLLLLGSLALSRLTSTNNKTESASATAPPLRVIPASTSSSNPVKAPSTTLVVLRIEAEQTSLVASFDKPLPFVRAETGSADYCLEDAVTGAVLDQGRVEIPELCSCPIGRDHALGCTVVPHSAVIRMKLPRLAGSERLRLFSGRSAERRQIGNLILESHS